MVTINSCDYSPIENFVQIGGANGTLVSVNPSTVDFVLCSNGASAPSFKSIGLGNVTAASNLTDNAVIRGDGGAKGIQTTTTFINDNGAMYSARQACFSAYASANIDDVTGDGTTYLVIFNSEFFDQGSNYNTATGAFTAPRTGRYLFCGRVILSGITSSHTDSLVRIATSNLANNQTWRNSPYKIVSAAGYSVASVSAICDMDGGDIAYMDVTVANGAKVVDIVGTSAYSHFSGYLMC